MIYREKYAIIAVYIYKKIKPCMSASFDPTKLDLDINSEDWNTQSAQESNQEEINSSIKEFEEKNTSIDPLGDIDSSKSSDEKNVWIASKNPQEENKQEATTISSPTQEENTEEKAQEAPEVSEEEEKEIHEEYKKERKLIDINIESLDSIVTLIDENDYEYITIEPEDMQVKVTFKQDNIDREIKYIKFPTYTNILFKTKQATKMEIEDASSSQEGKWQIKVGSKTFKIAAKTAPGQNGENIWIKAKEDATANNKKVVKKTSFSMILGFLWAILFVWLVLGGSFIAFIVLNAKTVEDVKFFASLGINLNDINTFISQVVTLIFSILLFLCTAALSFGLFKFFLTKKAYKQKKVFYGIMSGILLIITFATWSAWMVIDQKIKALPNWQEQAYGDLKIFDNSLLISEDFSVNQALLSETENLIWPITLQFDLSNFQNNQARKGLNIEKYSWDFGDETVETFSPIVTKTFDTVGNYEIAIIASGKDLQWETVEQSLANIPPISVSHVIKVEETLTNNGGKKLSFDASDLENLGKIKWYLKEPKSESNPSPFYENWEQQAEEYKFIPGRIFFDELWVGISIINGTRADPGIDKIMIISPDGISEITWEINYTQDLEEELNFEFFIQDPTTSFANGFIERYEWLIEDKTYTTWGNFAETTSPAIEHIFRNYGEHTITVTLTDSKGKSETLTKTITIQKWVELRSPLIILDTNEEEIPKEDFKYEEKSNEYYIDNLWVPSELRFDARYVRPINILYSLQDVSWDIWDDGNIDAKGKSYIYDVPTEWNHVISVEYVFVHRKKSDDIIKLKQFIYVEWVKKEAILDLKMEKSTNYAPVTVRFDASQSFIKNDDIIKFIYDYGDGISEERDAINPGHRYSEAGDYTVKLTVVGSTGKSYSIEKQLILLPPPQTVKISTSLKKAPIWQGIDFSSAESEWQIVEFFWDFGDGNVSTEANPTHSYKKTGIYTVKLKADFANKNSITDEMEIEIVENN